MVSKGTYLPRFQRMPWFVRRLHLSPFPPDDIPRQLNQEKEIRTRYFGRKEENVQPYGDRGGLPKRRHHKRRVGRQSTHDTYRKHPRPHAGIDLLWWLGSAGTSDPLAGKSLVIVRWSSSQSRARLKRRLIGVFNSSGVLYYIIILSFWISTEVFYRSTCSFCFVWIYLLIIIRSTT